MELLEDDLQEPNNFTCLHDTRIKVEPVFETEMEEIQAIKANTTYPGKSEIKEPVWHSKDHEDVVVVGMYPNADVENKQSTERETSAELSPPGTELSPPTKKTCTGREKKKRRKLSHKFICDICDRSFKHSSYYEGHLREHAGEENTYWCDKCERKYPSYTKLSAHMWKHSLDGHWECSQCTRTFTRHDRLKSHMIVHDDPDSVTCKICHIQFASARYLTQHMAVHEDEKPFECVVCDMRFNFQGLLKRHMRVHTGESPMTACKTTQTCEVCGKVFQMRKALEYHMSTHTGDKPYACRFCDKSFAQPSTRLGHETTHVNTPMRATLNESEKQLEANMDDAFSCKRCLFSFISQSHLEAHVRNSHALRRHKRNLHSSDVKDVKSKSKPKSFDCDICRRPFTTLQHVRRHKRNLHSTDVKDEKRSALFLDHADSSSSGTSSAGVASAPALVECRVCGKKVSRLENHMRTHKERAFICRVCGMRFTLAVNLKRHLRLHTGEKVSKPECPICGKIFAAMYKMRLHQASHVTGEKLAVDNNKVKEVVHREKKYKCDTCGKMFLDNQHVNRHKNVHRKGEKRLPPL